MSLSKCTKNCLINTKILTLFVEFYIINLHSIYINIYTIFVNLNADSVFYI